MRDPKKTPPKFTLSISDDLLKRLKLAAVDEGTTVSGLVVRLIERHLASKGKEWAGGTGITVKFERQKKVGG